MKTLFDTLADEATLVAIKKYPDQDNYGRSCHPEYETFRNSVFAELVLKEALRVLDPAGDLTSLREEVGRLTAMHIIKTHFGIK